MSSSTVTFLVWCFIGFCGTIGAYLGVVYCLPPLMKAIYARCPWLLADYRRRRINPRELCPSCGFAGVKDMRFNHVEKVLVVQCPRCLACWAHDPLVKAQAWAKPPEE